MQYRKSVAPLYRFRLSEHIRYDVIDIYVKVPICYIHYLLLLSILKSFFLHVQKFMCLGVFSRHRVNLQY